MRRIAFALIDAWYAIQHRLPARLLLWRPMAFVCSWIATWEICLMDTNGEIAQAVRDMHTGHFLTYEEVFGKDSEDECAA